MKKTICTAALFLLCGVAAFAEIPVPFFGGNNFTIYADTIFAADANNGSTGLETSVDIGLWFEFTPYGDRNITPQRDAVSVSLKLANSAFTSWRGFGPENNANADYLQDGYAVHTWDRYEYTQLWFDNFIAQLEYNQYWVRISGLDPEITLSTASIRSVFDPLINNRKAADKNRMPLPMFNTGPIWYWDAPGGGRGSGIVSVIGRDLVHLNRREVQIAGNLSAGMKTEIFDLALKGGSWKSASRKEGVQQNDENSWVGGGDLTWRPDLAQAISFSFLGAVNYGTITFYDNEDPPNPTYDPMASATALVENPFAVGLGYEYRINLPGQMVFRPYAGFDFICETNTGDYNWEIGGGFQWYFRGTGARFKRNTKIGGGRLGDVEIPAAFFFGMNVDNNNIVNAVFSFNEAPQTSLIPKFGGFMNLELMNIGGKEYTVDGKTFNDFLWAGMIQLEYLVHEKIMPYIFARYIPAEFVFYGDNPDPFPVFNRDYINLTTRLGCRFTPFRNFSVDFWYERTDKNDGKDWTADNGLVSIHFGIEL